MLRKNELPRVEETNTLSGQPHWLHEQLRLKEAIYAPIRNMHADARDTIAWTCILCMHSHARDISAKQVRKYELFLKFYFVDLQLATYMLTTSSDLMMST